MIAVVLNVRSKYAIAYVRKCILPDCLHKLLVESFLETSILHIVTIEKANLRNHEGMKNGASLSKTMAAVFGTLCIVFIPSH